MPVSTRRKEGLTATDNVPPAEPDDPQPRRRQSKRNLSSTKANEKTDNAPGKTSQTRNSPKAQASKTTPPKRTATAAPPKDPSPKSNKKKATESKSRNSSSSQAKGPLDSGGGIRKRRSPEEVAAEKERKLKVKEDRKGLEGMLQQELADRWRRFEEEEGLAVEHANLQAIRRFSDVLEAEPVEEYIPIDNVSDVENIDDGVDSGNDGLVKEIGVGPGIVDSDARIREIRSQIEALNRELSSMSSSKKGKQTHSTQPNVASGLRTEFRAAVPKESSQPKPFVPAIGGLNDEDIDDIRPSKAQAKFPVIARQGNRAWNNLVHAASVGKSEPIHSPGTGQYVDPLKPPSLAAVQSLPTTVTPLTKRSYITKRSQLSPAQATSLQESGRSSTKPFRLTSTTVRIDHLPRFCVVEDKWRKKFLPTLSYLLYTSNEPFKDFALTSPNLVKHVQKAVNLVYSNVAYEVMGPDDPVLLMSYNRINERRSAIASDALANISKHLRSFSTPAEAKAWLLWARQIKYGPLFFQDPTPLFCTSDPSHPDFITPHGRLKSVFVITLARDALGYTTIIKSLVKDAGETVIPPVGLFALIAASLERAIMSVQADGSVAEKASKFSDENYGSKVCDYIRGIKGLGQAQWDDILEICGSHGDDYGSEGELEGDQSLLDIEHQDIFAFASPKKR